MKIFLSFILITYSITTQVFSQENNKNSTMDNTLTIEGFYEAPLSLQDESTIVIKGMSEGEYIECIIQGEIKNFELVKLKIDDDSGELVESEVLHCFEQLSNQTLIIKTYLTEGIPVEKIKWESTTGKQFDCVIAEDGRDGGLKKQFKLE